MRFLNIIFIIVFTAGLTFAQSNEEEGFILEDEQDVEESVVKKDPKKKKIHTNIAIGSSFMGTGNNNYALNTYVHPTISYQLTPKFSVSMGLMAVQSNFNNLTYYNFYEGQAETVNYSGTSAYYTLQGAYQLSEKLKVYGGVMVGTQSMDFVGTQMPNETNPTNPKAYQLGFEYKIGKHASLQFEFQFRESNSIQNMQMQSGRGFNTMGGSSMFGPRIW